jgi:hypothetical protein
VQPYDDAGVPPPDDPAADPTTRESPDDPTLGEPAESEGSAASAELSDPADPNPTDPNPTDPNPTDPNPTDPNPAVTPAVDPRRHRGPMSPSLRSHARVIALIVAAVLVAAGVAFVWGDDAQRGASQARPTPTAQRTSNAAVSRSAGIGLLLERRASAVRDHDKTAFLALIDPTAEQFRVEQSDLFDRLADVPLSSWSYELAGDGPALPKDRSLLLPKGSTIARVRLDYQLEGSDSKVEREQYFTVVPRGGQWLLAGNDDAAASGLKTEPDIWDLGPVSVVHGKSSLVLGNAPEKDLQRLAAEADRGVRDVGGVWKRNWSRHPVVVMPKSQSDMAALIGNDGKGLSQIAAVTTGSFESGLSRGDRVVVNPDAWRTLGALGRRVVLAHEMTHLATRAITVNDVPIWLSEGFADYVAYQAVEVPTNVVAGDVLDDVRAGKGPKELPNDADFDASQGDIAAAYEGAWLACRMIAENFGQKKLIALYVSYADDKSEPESEDIKATLGISQAQLVKQWRAYLTARAAA